MRLALVSWCVIIPFCNQVCGQEQQGVFQFFPVPNLKFNFDRDLPFKQADFGDDFLRQIVGDRDQQKQQLARIEVSKADESKLGKNQFSLFAKKLRSPATTTTKRGMTVQTFKTMNSAKSRCPGLWDNSMVCMCRGVKEKTDMRYTDTFNSI